MLLLNYAHPLTTAQLARVAELLGAVPELREVKTQIDQALPLAPQVAALADAAGLSPEQRPGTPLIVNPPGLAPAAVALIAEIHGRTGHFPTLLRLRPVQAGPTTTFEAAELIDLHTLREAARARRRCAAAYSEALFQLRPTTRTAPMRSTRNVRSAWRSVQ